MLTTPVHFNIQMNLAFHEIDDVLALVEKIKAKFPNAHIQVNLA